MHPWSCSASLCAACLGLAAHASSVHPCASAPVRGSLPLLQLRDIPRPVTAEEPPKPDMLRALAVAFHTVQASAGPAASFWGDEGEQQAEAQPAFPTAATAAAPAAASQAVVALKRSQLQTALGDFAQIVHAWQQQEQEAAPARQHAAQHSAVAAHLPQGAAAPAGAEGASVLRTLLLQHGIGGAEAHSLGELLQAVLDSMDSIAERAEQAAAEDATPAATAPATLPAVVEARLRELNGHLEAAAAALKPAAPQPAGPSSKSSGATPPGHSAAMQQTAAQPSALEQLSMQFSQLLTATSSQLQEVQEQLHVAQQLQAVADAVATASLTTPPPVPRQPPASTPGQAPPPAPAQLSSGAASAGAQGIRPWQQPQPVPVPVPAQVLTSAPMPEEPSAALLDEVPLEAQRQLDSKQVAMASSEAQTELEPAIQVGGVPHVHI